MDALELYNAVIKTIDKVVFGFENVGDDANKKPDTSDTDNEEEFDDDAPPGNS
jgi:hypothetical protein